MVLSGERRGKKAERCTSLRLVDEAGNVLGVINFKNTGEINIFTDPRLAITMESGGIDFTRNMSEFRAGIYYLPVKPTTENNMEVISRHRESLLERDVKINSGSVSECYSFTTKSR